MDKRLISLLGGMLLFLAACGKPSGETRSEATPSAPPPPQEESQSGTPEEKAAIDAGKPFLEAILRADYSAAYDQLSSHAKASMSLSQFVPPSGDSGAKEPAPLSNVTVQDFQSFMEKAIAFHGKPAKVISSSVMGLGPEALSGKGAAIERAFTIGLMPDTIPVEIRKASIRSQIGVTLSDEELKKTAQQEGISVEELQKDESFSPYCNLKVVLVEEDGKLKVGYFEFTPPSMMD